MNPHHRSSCIATWLAWAALLLLSVAACGHSVAAEPPSPTSPTGPSVPELAALDQVVAELMQKGEIPGGALAVARQGRLVLAHGYGLADVDKQQPVEPDALFRIASLSKPITAAAVLVLLEQGRLDLDAKVLDLLGEIKPLQGESINPQFREITIRQLLQHTGGFDRNKSFDPMFRSRWIARAAGLPPPADSRSIIRFMLSRPLDFPPGERYAYSNFGYCLLGRVIEKLTGQSYESAMGALVLRPAGISRMRLGRTRLADRAEGEVHYYTYHGPQMARSVFPDVKQRVLSPYGEFYLEAMDSHGGWIASAVDLVRFATRLDGSRPPGLLKPQTLRLIESRPPPPASADEPLYYGLGWQIRTQGEDAGWRHAGSLPGTCSLLLRSPDGLVFAVVFNLRPPGDTRLMEEAARRLCHAAAKVHKWPQHDLFEKYP
jgi:N-acyl-D-amino-acid deacylase